MSRRKIKQKLGRRKYHKAPERAVQMNVEGLKKVMRRAMTEAQAARLESEAESNVE